MSGVDPAWEAGPAVEQIVNVCLALLFPWAGGTADTAVLGILYNIGASVWMGAPWVNH